MRAKINKRKSYQNKWCSRIEIGCLEELLHRLRQTGTVKVLQDNAGFVSKIIFARNDMIDVYHKFPEVVGIDCTYKTNKMGWPLYQFVVTDGFGRGRTVLFALTRRETFADIKEILQTFKRFMVDTSKTLTFTVDCATAQMKALKEEFPSCNIVLCLFHVCKAFRRKFPNQLVKKWLYGMAHTRSYD
uniref:ZSWIM1/3 RNaseH-like domain-containing protein n=1 Tax=Trichobilharzia regenti TaxID=157069 RepID=A0AA85IZV8_TRIRE